MHTDYDSGWPTVIAGFGSPNGDEQAGWRLAATLQQSHHVPARVLAILEPQQLIDALTGCRRLIVVDSCRGNKRPGTITRLRWPDPRIYGRHGHPTQDIDVVDTLRLADRLERLPPLVEVYGIESSSCSPGADVSAVASWAVANLAARIIDQLHELACA